MTGACCPAWAMITEAEATQMMRRWRMLDGFASLGTNGAMVLTSVRSAMLDRWSQQMVSAGYGIRRPRGIELNAAGLALWNVANP